VIGKIQRHCRIGEKATRIEMVTCRPRAAIHRRLSHHQITGRPGLGDIGEMSKKRIVGLSGFLSLAVFLGSMLTHGAVMQSGGYQLIGKITLKERELSQRALPIVLLEGTKIAFSARTHADPDGKFIFKNLQPDLFTLTVVVPKAGEYQRTVEVSPGLADSQKRVFIDVLFEPNFTSKSMHQISSTQLSIPEKALRGYQKANEKLGKRDSEGAIAHLQKSLRIAPQFVDAWNTLGTLAYKSDDLTLAESYFREALKHEPEYYPSLVNLGGIVLAQGKTQDALPLNRAAVQAKPDDALAHAQLGLTYFYLNQYAEAEKYLKQAVSLDPGHFSFPQLPLAEIYISRQDFTSAAGVLKQFLALHPDAEQSPAVRKRIENIRSRLLRK
jgi:tetratricopeptide (TPR) repeat protein